VSCRKTSRVSGDRVTLAVVTYLIVRRLLLARFAAEDISITSLGRGRGQRKLHRNIQFGKTR